MGGACALSIPGDAPASAPDIARARRLRVLAGLGAAALALHVALLGDLEWSWPAGPARRAAMSVRTLTLPPAAETKAETATATAPGGARADRSRAADWLDAVHAPIPAAPARVAARPVPVTRRPVPRPHPEAAPDARQEAPNGADANDAPLDPQPAAVDPSPVVIAKAVSPSADDAPIPVYSTRLPGPVVARYSMRRGASRGEAELRWAPRPDGYDLRFEGRLGESVVISQASEGLFDAAGLAPLRFTDRRQRSRRVATNFRRDTATISYSASTEEHPLASGAQDRLSWMLQLASIVAADPVRRIAGANVVMAVAGVRGAPDIWNFVCGGADGPRVDAGVRCVRESRGVYDSRVEAWLDPGRGFLPSRVVMSTGVEAQTIEIVFQALVAEPGAALPDASRAASPELAFGSAGPK